jgi:hypothetical protein
MLIFPLKHHLNKYLSKISQRVPVSSLGPYFPSIIFLKLCV